MLRADDALAALLIDLVDRALGVDALGEKIELPSVSSRLDR